MFLKGRLHWANLDARSQLFLTQLPNSPSVIDAIAQCNRQEAHLPTCRRLRKLASSV
jgi:hypothetical protein